MNQQEAFDLSQELASRFVAAMCDDDEFVAEPRSKLQGIRVIDTDNQLIEIEYNVVPLEKTVDAPEGEFYAVLEKPNAESLESPCLWISSQRFFTINL